MAYAIITGVFTLIGIFVGYYLARSNEVNREISVGVERIKERLRKGYGEPFVVDTNEAAQEAEENAGKEKNEKINIKDFKNEL